MASEKRLLFCPTLLSLRGEVFAISVGAHADIHPSTHSSLSIVPSIEYKPQESGDYFNRCIPSV